MGSFLVPGTDGLVDKSSAYAQRPSVPLRVAGLADRATMATRTASLCTCSALGRSAVRVRAKMLAAQSLGLVRGVSAAALCTGSRVALTTESPVEAPAVGQVLEDRWVPRVPHTSINRWLKECQRFFIDAQQHLRAACGPGHVDAVGKGCRGVGPHMKSRGGGWAPALWRCYNPLRVCYQESLIANRLSRSQCL